MSRSSLVHLSPTSDCPLLFFSRLCWPVLARTHPSKVRIYRASSFIRFSHRLYSLHHPHFPEFFSSSFSPVYFKRSLFHPTFILFVYFIQRLFHSFILSNVYFIRFIHPTFTSFLLSKVCFIHRLFTPSFSPLSFLLPSHPLSISPTVNRAHRPHSAGVRLRNGGATRTHTQLETFSYLNWIILKLKGASVPLYIF